MCNYYNQMVCPQCGNRDLQVTNEVNTTTSGSNFSAGQGCLGYLLFGPLGILCGSCGKSQHVNTTNTTYWICPKCGEKFRNPDDLDAERRRLHLSSNLAMAFGIILALATLVIAVMVDESEFYYMMFAIVVIFGFLFAVLKASAKKSDDEYWQIKNGMNKFNNK